jgi:hypothetical protein
MPLPKKKARNLHIDMGAITGTNTSPGAFEIALRALCLECKRFSAVTNITSAHNNEGGAVEYIVKTLPLLRSSKHQTEHQLAGRRLA